MHYLYLLVFIFLSVFSYSVSAAEPPHPEGCVSKNFYGGNQSTLNAVKASCASTASINLIKSWTDSNTPYVRCMTCSDPCFPGQIYNSATKTCACPEGTNTVTGAGGVPSCEPIEPTPSDCPDGAPKVYDPSSGQMVCPVSEGGSSSQASSFCLVPGDYNNDCIPDDEQGSSSGNSSVPTSTPASTPNTSNPTASSPSTGGGGGGGGGDDGSGNSGGGSASAAASSSGSNNSWTPHSGYGNWIPVGANSTCPNKYQDQSGQWWCSGANSNQFGSAASQMAISGECDYTSKTYFTCITSGAGSNTSTPPSGSNSSWTPISGYGNWIPVEEDSPCPNKFKDAQGKWWCAGGASGSGGAGGSSGSAASGGASGSARSASGKCDNTSEDYLKCISGQLSSGGSASSASSANSSSGSSRSGAYSSLGEKGEFDEELHEKKLEDLTKELEDKIADIKEDVAAQVGGTISGSGGIQDFCKNIRGNEVCFGMKKFESYLDPIANAIFLVCCVLAFVIVLRS